MKDVITIRVMVDLFYDIPRESLPDYVTSLGMEKLVEEAFKDADKQKKTMTLKDFSKEGLLRLEPSEVAVNTVLAM